jgi:hypothetical protein
MISVKAGWPGLSAAQAFPDKAAPNTSNPAMGRRPAPIRSESFCAQNGLAEVLFIIHSGKLMRDSGTASPIRPSWLHMPVHPDPKARIGVSPPANAWSELTENGRWRGTVGANVLTLDAKKEMQSTSPIFGAKL